MTGRVEEIIVVEEVGIARRGGLVSASVAAPPGALPSAEGVGCADGNGSPVPTQAQALERWPDGSVRWLGLRLLADTPGQSSQGYAVTRNAVGPEAPVGATADGDGVRVDNGLGAVVVKPGPFRALDQLAGVRTSELSIVDLEGRRYAAIVREVSIDEGGPVHASVHAVGDYRRDDGVSLFGFEATVGLTAGSRAVIVDVRIINREPGETASIAEWSLGLTTEASSGGARCGVYDQVHRSRSPFSIRHAGDGHMRGIFATSKVVSDADDWEDVSPPEYWDVWEWAELHGRQATNWVDVALADGAELAVGVSRFDEDHPSELAYTGDGARVGLWPEWGGELVLVQGMAKTRRVVIETRPTPEAESHLLGMRIESPLVGWQPGAAEAADVPLGVLPYLPERYPNLEALVRGELSSWYSSGQSLGFIDHGDGMQGITRGPRTGFSANNEHDSLYALVLHFLRSGERAYYDAAEAYANHLIDIDLIHHSDRNDFETGGVRAHGRNHVQYYEARTAAGVVQTSIDTGHIWVEGLLWFGAVSNDRRYQDAARTIGDCLLRLVDLGWARPQPGPRNAGWPLIALSALARSTGESKYLDGARQVARDALAAQRPDGQWTMRLAKTDSGSGWQMGLLLTGLSRLYALDPTPEIDEAMRRGFRAVLTFGRHRDGTFTNYDRFDYGQVYDTGMIRETLAAAYRHTGDVEYLRAGLLGGNRWYWYRRGTPTRSNQIAEWRGHLPFLACAHEAGLLVDIAP